RPKVLRQPNSGSARARNVGIAASTGSVIAFLDADDIWRRDKLALQLALLDRHPDTGLVFCHARPFHDEGGRRLVGDSGPPRRHRTSLQAFVLGNQTSTPCVLLRRAAYDHVGPLDEDDWLRGVEDYHYWLRVVAHFPARFVPETLVIYRVNPNSLV